MEQQYHICKENGCARIITPGNGYCLNHGSYPRWYREAGIGTAMTEHHYHIEAGRIGEQYHYCRRNSGDLQVFTLEQAERQRAQYSSEYVVWKVACSRPTEWVDGAPTCHRHS